MKENVWVLIVSSAAVGALVSSTISLLAGILERRARKQELIFDASLILAKEWILRRFSGEAPAHMIPHFIYVQIFHKILTEIFERGTISQPTMTLIRRVYDDLMSGKYD